MLVLTERTWLCVKENRLLEIIENCCTPYYLDSMKYHVMNSCSWNLNYPQNKPFEDKHLKIDVINNEVKEPLLAGLSMGLLMNIYGIRQDLFLPEVSFCGISMKDKHRDDNVHTDHVNETGYIKVLGLLNSDWGPNDGGLFMHGDEAIPMKPCTFVVFDPRVPHCASPITSDKKRLGIDWTVKQNG